MLLLAFIICAVLIILFALITMDFFDMFTQFDKENGSKCDSKK